MTRRCTAPNCASPVAGTTGHYAHLCPDCLRAGWRWDEWHKAPFQPLPERMVALSR